MNAGSVVRETMFFSSDYSAESGRSFCEDAACAPSRFSGPFSRTKEAPTFRSRPDPGPSTGGAGTMLDALHGI